MTVITIADPGGSHDPSAFNSGCPCCAPRRGCRGASSSAPPRPARWRLPPWRRARSAAAEAAPQPAKPGRPILIKGGCVLSLDRAVGDFEQADVLIEGKQDLGGAAEHQRAQRAGDRRLEVDRDAGLRRYPPPHVAGLPAQRAAGRLARGLPQRRAAHVRRQDGAGRRLCRRPAQRARRIDAGVTCVLDWSHIHNSPEHTDAAIKGLQESGVRGGVRLWHAADRVGQLEGRAERTNIPTTSRACASSTSPATTS